jgi:hypothetical protein
MAPSLHGAMHVYDEPSLHGAMHVYDGTVIAWRRRGVMYMYEGPWRNNPK